MKSLVYSMKNKQIDNEHFNLLIPGKEKAEAVCNWNEGISKSTLSDFQEITQWYFPEDFKEFLEVSNGCTLFTHPHNGGGVDILDLERIRRVHEEIIQIPDHWYPVAWTDFVAGAICIDSEKCKYGTKPYMFFFRCNGRGRSGNTFIL